MRKLRIASVLLAITLTMAGCFGGGSKSLVIGSTKVEFDKMRRFTYMEYPTPTAFEADEDSPYTEWEYTLKEDGQPVYRYVVESIFILFSRAAVEEDLAAELAHEGAAESSQKINKKQWAIVEYTAYNEDFGKDVKTRVYYTSHTKVSETYCIKLTFVNTDACPNFEKTFINAMKFK